MSTEELPVTGSQLSLHSPVFQTIADEYEMSMARLPLPEVCRLLGIKMPTACKVQEMANRFFDKSTGLEVKKAFTGEVFRALDLESLPPENDLGKLPTFVIISSLYGMLRPEDIVKAYRFDYNITLPGQSASVSKNWKQPLTVSLVRHLKSLDSSLAVNLLPAEADKCLDWKVIKAFTSVIKPVFKIVAPDGTLKTPPTRVLKSLRGRVARRLLESGVKTVREFLQWKEPDLAIEPDQSKPGMPVLVHFPKS